MSESGIPTFGQAFQEITAPAVEQMARSVCPVFDRRTARENPRMVGCCVLLNLGGHRFLVTARHVWEVLEGRPLQLPLQGLGAGNEFDAISTNDGGPADDRFDFAVAKLPGDLPDSKYKFLSIGEIDVRDSNDASKPQCAIGYPWAFNKNPFMHDLDGQKTIVKGKAKLKYMPFSTGIDRSVNLDDLKVGHGTHLALRYDPEAVETDSALPAEPKNMSGGGVWYFPTLGNVEARFLTGIIISHHSKIKVLLAIKCRMVLSAIAESFPEVVPVLTSAGFRSAW